MVPTRNGRLEYNSQTTEATSKLGGSTQGLPTSSLDGEIDERIQGRKTPLQEKGMDAKKLMVESLCLPRDETSQIIWRGR